jgi:hypothetical protein
LGEALAAVGHLLHVGPGAIHTRVTTDNSNAPECFVSVPSRRLRMWVSVSSEPQPYAVLERAAVEEAQMFTATRTTPAPQHVDHLGLDAYWFPGAPDDDRRGASHHRDDRQLATSAQAAVEGGGGGGRAAVPGALEPEARPRAGPVTGGVRAAAA